MAIAGIAYLPYNQQAAAPDLVHVEQIIGQLTPYHLFGYGFVSLGGL
jgi:hypothetical protein